MVLMAAIFETKVDALRLYFIYSIKKCNELRNGHTYLFIAEFINKKIERKETNIWKWKFDIFLDQPK